MDHLAARGINCPRPIHGRDGKALRTLAGRPAAITTFLQGMWPRRMTVQPLRPGRRGAGRAASGRPRLRAQAAQCAVGRRLAAVVRGLAPSHRSRRSRAELTAELDFFEANWPTGLPSGVIHADLFNDNVLFLHDRLSGLIDFYFACNDFLRLRRGDLPERLVLRARQVVQRHQGPRPAAGLRQACGRSATTSARRCRCWRAARRCASC